MPSRMAECWSVAGQTVRISNMEKVLFPRDGITKGELVAYYRRVARLALPYCRDRALTMQRFPDGIGEDGFYQKDVPDHFPDWVDRATLDKKDGTVDYVIANDAATLVFLANQGCVTPHVALARCDRPNCPDRLIFDLDPSDDDFGKVQQAAACLKTQLDELRLTSFVQTTGSRGLHVVVPLDRGTDFDSTRAFAKELGECLAARHPDFLTTEQRKDDRGSRVFIDYLRNAFGQTAVAPYAVRALDGAPVATPLRWEEALASDLSPRSYTIRNVFRRLAQVDDPWAPMLRRRYSIHVARRRLKT